MAALLSGTLIIPMPYATHTQGLVWVPDDARVRNEVEGFVDEILIADGQQVKAGQELLRLSNPELFASRQQLQTRLNSQRQAYQGALLNQPSSAIALGEEIVKLTTQIDQFDQRIAALSLRSPVSGTLGLPAAHDLPGRFFNRGSVIANVISPDHMTVRMVLAQQDIDLLRSSTPRFLVRNRRRQNQKLACSACNSDPPLPPGNSPLPCSATGRAGLF